MKRWSIRILGVLCLLLLGGTIWMWVRSWWWDDQFQRSMVTAGSGIDYECFTVFSSSKGKIGIERLMIRWPRPLKWENGDVQTRVSRWQWFTYSTDLAAEKQGYTNWREFAGVGYGSKQTASRRLVVGAESASFLLLPYRWVALLIGMGPILWARWEVKRVVRTRRLIRGLCVECGYDLRASDLRGCPECGRGMG